MRRGVSRSGRRRRGSVRGKKSGAVREVTIRIYDEEALLEIISKAEYAGDNQIKVSACREAEHLAKISLDIAVERWIEWLCQFTARIRTGDNGCELSNLPNGILKCEPPGQSD